MTRTAVKSLIGAALLALVATTPAHAQRMGSANRNAPTVTHKIEFGSDAISVKFTSITWAAGQWAAQLANEATREGFRARVNQAAEAQPLGSLDTSLDVTLGGQKVAAGSYKLAFTLDDAYHWQIQLTSDAGKVVIPLALKETEHESKRLVLWLGAGDQDRSAEVTVAFGKSRCALPVTLAK
jgi:hypothetical protein